MIIIVVLKVVRDTWTKMTFCYGANNFDIVAVKIFSDFWFHFVLLVSGVVYVYFGFRCSLFEFALGTISGVFNMTCSLLTGIVIMKGLAGPGEALFETSILFHMVLEIVIFNRVPNLMQVIGVGFVFAGIAFIIFGNRR